MIFDVEPIDDTFLELVKALKNFTKVNPKMTWVKDDNTWILNLKDWIGYDLCVSYTSINSKKYSIFVFDDKNTVSEKLGTYYTIKTVLRSLYFINLSSKGVSEKVIEFLIKETKKITFVEAVDKLVKESDIIITQDEMEILGIDNNLRGTVHGKNYGF